MAVLVANGRPSEWGAVDSLFRSSHEFGGLLCDDIQLSERLACLFFCPLRAPLPWGATPATTRTALRVPQRPTVGARQGPPRALARGPPAPVRGALWTRVRIPNWPMAATPLPLAAMAQPRKPRSTVGA